MRLKSFHAASLTQALDQVRDHFGQDAAILATQEHDEGGFTVTAAIDAPLDESQGQVEESAPKPAPATTQEAGEHEEISDALEHHRIPPGLAQRLLQAAEGYEHPNKRTLLAAALKQFLTFEDLTRPGQLAPGQAHLLVGPCGAGKTATVAKLCALARLRGVPTRLATMDFESAGSYEQVAAFAGVLETPLESIGKAKDLARLRQTAGEELLLVDTVGTNPFSHDEVLRCAEVVAALGVRPILVLPAGGDPVESAETALIFAELGAKRLVPTRMDACRRLGGVLSAAFAAELTLSAAGVSPMIGNGLSGLSPKSLAKALMSLAPTPFSFSSNRESRDV